MPLVRNGIFDYAVSYCCLLAAAWLLSLVMAGYFKVWPPTLVLVLVLVLALVAALGDLIWYANACRALVEFDIDSFIHLRLHNKQDDQFLPVLETDADLASALADQMPSRGLCGALFLRHQLTGIFYEAYELVRGQVASLLRRK